MVPFKPRASKARARLDASDSTTEIAKPPKRKRTRHAGPICTFLIDGHGTIAAPDSWRGHARRDRWDADKAAWAFFELVDAEVTDALGIDIISGEHPGSTYYAAQLRDDLDAANAVAAEMGLLYRFERAPTL